MMVSAIRTDLPNWVKENMEMMCTYCGTYIMDNSDTGSTTARWCMNPACPGHMMHRAKVLADYFGIKGFGPQTAYKSIVARNYKTHFEFVKEWFKDEKPYASLADIATLACMEGYGETTAQKELNSFGSFTDYFARAHPPNPILLRNKAGLLDAEKYFNVKPPLSASKLFVMGTGSFHGYSSRDAYFRAVNALFGQYINVIQTGKRKTGISYLIKEKDAVDHSKSQIARECGIPIVTPKEFVAILLSAFPVVNGKQKFVTGESQ